MPNIQNPLFANFCSIVQKTFASNHNSVGTFFSTLTETTIEKKLKQLVEKLRRDDDDKPEENKIIILEEALIGYASNEPAQDQWYQWHQKCLTTILCEINSRKGFYISENPRHNVWSAAAMDAYDRGDKSRLVYYARQAMQTGEVLGAYYMALQNKQGLSSYIDAIERIPKAKQNAQWFYVKGLMAQYGIGQAEDATKALDFFSKSAELNYPYAYSAAAEIVLESEIALSAFLAKQNEWQQDCLAKVLQEISFKKGFYISEDPKHNIWSSAAMDAYDRGDKSRLAYYAKQAMQTGEALGLYYMALINTDELMYYVCVINIIPKEEQNAQWFYVKGLMAQHGIGQAENVTSALEFFKKSAALDYPYAYFAMSEIISKISDIGILDDVYCSQLQLWRDYQLSPAQIKYKFLTLLRIDLEDLGAQKVPAFRSQLEQLNAALADNLAQIAEQFKQQNTFPFAEQFDFSVELIVAEIAYREDGNVDAVEKFLLTSPACQNHPFGYYLLMCIARDKVHYENGEEYREKAIEYRDKATPVSVTTPFEHYMAGLVFDCKGIHEEARKEIQAAKEVNFPPALYLYATKILNRVEPYFNKHTSSSQTKIARDYLFEAAKAGYVCAYGKLLDIAQYTQERFEYSEQLLPFCERGNVTESIIDINYLDRKFFFGKDSDTEAAEDPSDEDDSAPSLSL